MPSIAIYTLVHLAHLHLRETHNIDVGLFLNKPEFDKRLIKVKNLTENRSQNSKWTKSTSISQQE